MDLETGTSVLRMTKRAKTPEDGWLGRFDDLPKPKPNVENKLRIALDLCAKNTVRYRHTVLPVCTRPCRRDGSGQVCGRVEPGKYDS